MMGSQPIRIQLGKLLRENLAGNSCGKFLWEIVVGKSCGKWRRGKSQFKKGSDWWKFTIWNRVMGDNQSGSSSGKSCGKILWENLVGKSCGKFLREIVVGKSCGKLLRENLAGKCCGKFLQEIVARKCCGKFLWENLAGNSHGKILWEILAGNSCGKWRRGKSCCIFGSIRIYILMTGYTQCRTNERCTYVHLKNLF